MKEPMSDSYKKATEEFRKLVENLLGRYEDFRKVISPRPRYEPLTSLGQNEYVEKENIPII